MNWVMCRECGVEFRTDDWSDGCDGHLCEDCRRIIYGDDPEESDE